MAHALHAEMWLPLPVERVFAFFADVANLDLLTPPWVQFTTVTPGPIVLQAGTLIEHRLRVHHVPIRWLSEITVWNPPVQFVDEQRRGPYKSWKHRHDFETKGDGALIRDSIEYRVRGWFCAALINRWLVRPDLRAIFAFRQKKLRELLAPGSDAADDKIEFL